MRSFSTDRFGQRSHEKFIFSKRVSEITILILGKCSKIDEHGHEWVRHGSPRAHIRRGRSYGLYEASGTPPDPFSSNFRSIFSNLWVDRVEPNFSMFLLYIPF